MRRIHFPEDDITQLNKERLQHKHPVVRRRMTALYLKAKGYRHKDICKELGISHVCLYEYLDLYIKDGLDGPNTLATEANATYLTKTVTASLLTLRPILGLP